MVTGTCLCGGVSFEIEGNLTPMQYCHATRCRKVTGAAFVPEVAARVSQLRWLRGRELVTVYEAPLLREPPAYRHAFCRICGSPVPVELEGIGYVMLQAGVLDDPPELHPFRRIFVGQNPPWHAITDDLPRFEEHAPRDQRLRRPEGS